MLLASSGFVASHKHGCILLHFPTISARSPAALQNDICPKRTTGGSRAHTDSPAQVPLFACFVKALEELSLLACLHPGQGILA